MKKIYEILWCSPYGSEKYAKKKDIRAKYNYGSVVATASSQEEAEGKIDELLKDFNHEEVAFSIQVVYKL